MEDIKERLTRPLLTRNEALALALLLGLPLAADQPVEADSMRDAGSETSAAADRVTPRMDLLIG